MTIAVLPLENQGDPANDYFADGLTDEIIRNLSIIDGLTVPSRTSSFALKGKGLNAGEAGKQLGADYLVEGSVLHAGDQLRVTVALVRVGDEFRLWSERFDRKLTDVFAIQDEISRGIVNTLRLNFSPGRRRYETNLEAYDLYLRGRHIMASFPARAAGPSPCPRSNTSSKRSPKIRNYAIAYAGMADAFIAIERNVGTANPLGATILPAGKGRGGTGRRARPDALRSPQRHGLDSRTRIRVAGGRARVPSRDRAQPEQCPGASGARGLGSRRAGTFRRRPREVRRAVALDPLSPYVNTEVGAALLLAGRYGEAVDQLRKAIALDPSRNRPYNLLGRALTLQGKPAEALEAFDESIKRGIAYPEWVACAEVRAGRRDKALGILQQQLSDARSSRALARTYACLGDAGARARASGEMRSRKTNPVLRRPFNRRSWPAMRSDPRFAALRKQVNLTP